ncbi:hypothetical protein OF83DRAFT_1164319 [Amylostereum chailletii]|nr:hypothetical protein OF83DRAFT_1164319 [Amylostereum chailletii]
MKYTLACLVCFAVSVTAQSSAWGQCGGIGWAGSTTCVPGYTCTVSNEYYSQCLPGTASNTPAPAPTTTAIVSGSATNAPTTTIAAPTPTGTQIRSDQDPVFHLYLQNNNGTPVLGPEDTGGYFTISGSLSLNGVDGSTLYLNVDESASETYKPLTLDATATTTDWGLEGDTIITTDPRQLNFLACPTADADFWTVYLQEANDVPSGETCGMISLHLPCLC